MKTISLVVTFLLIGFVAIGSTGETGENANAAAVSSITGMVIDQQTGEPLAGVKLSIEGANKVIYSDLNGNFRITGLTPGEYNITSSFISYASENLNIDIAAGSPENVKIELSQVQ